MTLLESLNRARDLSKAIYETSRTDNLHLLSRLERERARLLSRESLHGLDSLENHDLRAATRLLEEILEFNEKARALLEPWHQDVKTYLGRLDENRRRRSSPADTR